MCVPHSCVCRNSKNLSSCLCAQLIRVSVREPFNMKRSFRDCFWQLHVSKRMSLLVRDSCPSKWRIWGSWSCHNMTVIGNLDKRTISFHSEYILYAWQMTIDTIKAQDMFLLSHCSRAPLNWPFSRTCRKWSEPLKYIAMLERSCAVNTVIRKQMHQIFIRLFRKTADE